jgi:hypothetical protein
MDAMPEINPEAAKATAQKATATLKSAGSLVLKKAERTKLVTVTLPRLYVELGKAVYKDGSRRQDFAELFKTADDLLAQRQQIRKAAMSRHSGNSIAEKAKKIAADAGDVAKAKALDLKSFQVFTKLGEIAYEKHGHDSGPTHLVAPIANAAAKRDQLDRDVVEISAESKGEWLTPKRVVWAGIACIGFALLAAIVADLPYNTSAMRRVADATLPAVYGDYEMKWDDDFLAGRKPSKSGWGGRAKMRNGEYVNVSFFPEGGDFVWLTSPSESGIHAAVYSDTLYWDSRGERIEDEKEFWKRTRYSLQEVMEEGKQLARSMRARENERKQRNLERLQKTFDEEYKKSKYR